MGVVVSGIYQGEKRVEALHQQSGCTLVTDAPLDNNGKGESFSPTDLLVTALGGCMLTIMGISAEKKQITLAGSKFTLEKHMSDSAPRKIAKITGSFQLPASLSEQERSILEKSARSCPVHHSLNSDIQVEIAFEYTL